MLVSCGYPPELLLLLRFSYFLPICCFASGTRFSESWCWLITAPWANAVQHDLLPSPFLLYGFLASPSKEFKPLSWGVQEFLKAQMHSPKLVCLHF